MTDAEYEVKLARELHTRDLADFEKQKREQETRQKEYDVKYAVLLEEQARVKAEIEVMKKRSKEIERKELDLAKRMDECFVKEAELTVRENMIKEKEGKDV